MLPQDSNQSKLSEKEVFNELANSLGHCFIQIGETLRRAEYSPNLLHHFLQTSNSLTNSLIFPPSTQDFSKKEEKLSSLSQNQKNASNQICLERKDNIEANFLYVIEEPFENSDEALQLLNFEASKHGFKFVKGSADKQRGYFSLYCKYKRKKGKISQESIKIANDDDQIEEKDKEPLEICCSAYYRWKLFQGKWTLVKSDQFHSHKGVDCGELSESMKEDLKNAPRWINIVSIMSFLEAKYNKKNLSYHKVYKQFRKIKPLLGAQDCAYFHNYLVQKGFHTAIEMNKVEQYLCKLFFASKIMKENYASFGDIVLIDSTYQTNIYKVPLVVFTGIAPDGRNIIFGMAFVNEKYATYQWLLKHFLQMHEKTPNLFVTDGDPAICKAVGDYFLQSEHFVCQWHLKRNLTRHFAYLKKGNNADPYYSLLKLPHVSDKALFEEKYRKVETFFQSDDSFKKSLHYLRELYSYKQKWANCYKKTMFTAGTNTTSRAESMNKSIKEFMGKKTELASMIELINKLDNNFAFDFPIKSNSKSKQSPSPSDWLLSNIQDELGPVIYRKHEKEFKQHMNFLVKPHGDKQEIGEEVKEYIISRDQIDEDDLDNTPKIATLTEDPPKLSCSCLLFVQEGIICRHVFSLAKVLQIKNLSKHLHPRWKIKEQKCQETHNFSSQEIEEVKKEEEEKFQKEEVEAEKELHLDSLVASSKKKKVLRKGAQGIIISESSSDDSMDNLDFKSPPTMKNFQKGQTKGRKTLKESKKRKSEHEMPGNKKKTN